MTNSLQHQHRWVKLFLCAAVFVALQGIKPMVLMTIYRTVYQFNPTLYSDWALYKLVWSAISAGSMNAQITIGILLGELLMLITPYGLYRFLFPAISRSARD
ncbi:hypothetical protein [Thalassotalea sediminis]|uniref:hypothetical protein n=1 Tax=Thalassotalea sediminis TaxID=1759089 RepID=UPI002572FFDE|nr:hypothetical protein [Thalassotalea sediminis]